MPRLLLSAVGASSCKGQGRWYDMSINQDNDNYNKQTI